MYNLRTTRPLKHGGINALSFDGRSLRIPHEYPHIGYFIFLETIESSAYILPVMVSIYLYSHFSGGLRNTFISARVTFQPFKVIQGH